MDNRSVQRETVTRKALRLYPTRTIEPVGYGLYSVEGTEVDYVVDLGIDGGVESCNCPATKACYHVSMATIYRAKARTAARRAHRLRKRRHVPHAATSRLWWHREGSQRGSGLLVYAYTNAFLRSGRIPLSDRLRAV